VKTAHDEYQALLWPSVGVAMTVFIASVFQIAQYVSDKTGSLSGFGVPQALVAVLAAVVWCLPVIRILGHVTDTRWQLARRLSATPPGEGETADSSSATPGTLRQGADGSSEDAGSAGVMTAVRTVMDAGLLVWVWLRLS
jgi:hypothetical protein